MKTKTYRFPNDFKLQVVQEYLSTDISQKELMDKYNIRGNNTIKQWMRKFDVQTPSQQQIELQRIMAKEKEKTPYERELEARVKRLESQLEDEKLRVLALSTMIDIAEKELKISIRKKSGAKPSKS
jgi:transposase-like protein